MPLSNTQINVSSRGNTNNSGDEDDTQFQTCSYLPGSMLVTLHAPFLLNSWASLWGKYYYPISQRRKLKFRDIKTFTQHHIAGKQQRQDLFLRNFFFLFAHNVILKFFVELSIINSQRLFPEKILKRPWRDMTCSKALSSKSNDRLIWWHINPWSILSFTESKWEFLHAHFSHLKQY